MENPSELLINLGWAAVYPVAAWLVVGLFNKMVHGRLVGFLESRGAEEAGEVVGRLQRPFGGLVIWAAAGVGWSQFTLATFVDAPAWAGVVDSAIFVVTAYFAASVAVQIVSFVLTAVLEPLAKKTEGKLDDQIIKILQSVGGIVVWVFAGVTVFGKFGVNVASMIAGLGIGGLAFALAAQDSISQAFGGIVLLLDKPFDVGDNVEVSGVSGTVEEVGIRSTKIRGFDKTLVTIPNASIAQDKIVNFSRRDGFRQILVLGMLYDTAPDKIRNAKTTLEEIIEKHPKTLNESWVNFTDFGASSLDMEVVYWIDVASGLELREVRHEVNLSIVEHFAEMGIGFAFPTRTLEWAEGQKPS